MRPSARVALVLALTILPVRAPSGPQAAADDRLPGILGSDDRVIVDSIEWPWAAIGRVNRASGGFCTGTLVASDLVLTAAHCVFDRTGRRLAPSALHFVGGYRRGRPLTHGSARRVLVAEGFAPLAPASLDRIANDWALLVLERPLATPPLPIRPLPEEAAPSSADGRLLPLLAAGYAQDRPHLLSLDADCSVAGRLADDRVIVHTCDGTRGSSGAPLLVRNGEGVFLVGILAGTLDVADREQSFAVHARAFAGPVGRTMTGRDRG